jgi:hypothetical protein
MDLRGARDLTAVSAARELHASIVSARLVAEEQAGAMHTFAAGPFTMFCLINAVQLTLTHPELGPQIREQLDYAARQLIHLFDGDGETVELLLKGFDR